MSVAAAPASDRLTAVGLEPVALLTTSAPMRSRVASALAGRPILEVDAPDDLRGGAGESVAAFVVATPEASQTRQAALLRDAEDHARDVPSIVVLREVTRTSLQSALRAGARGVLLEATLEATLAPAVEAVRSGLLVTPEDAQRQLAPPPLSSREKQALAMVVMGFSNAEIAGRLYLAESTIKSHLSSAFSKLGVRSRNEATALILDPVVGLGPGILAISPRSHPEPAGGPSDDAYLNVSLDGT